MPARAGLAERIGLQPKPARAVAAELDAVMQREARDWAAMSSRTQHKHRTMVQSERE
jgi:hypothetical protein